MNKHLLFAILFTALLAIAYLMACFISWDWFPFDQWKNADRGFFAFSTLILGGYIAAGPPYILKQTYKQ